MCICVVFLNGKVYIILRLTTKYLVIMMEKLSTTAVLAATLTTIVATAVVFGLLSTSYRIPNSVSVKSSVGLGVYSDQACTTPLTSINWGEVTPGQSYQRTIYVKNLGNVKVKLNMNVGNWTPSSASNYLTLTWNRENYDLNIGESIGATLTLTVSSNAPAGSFSFDISIIATETQ